MPTDHDALDAYSQVVTRVAETVLPAVAEHIGRRIEATVLRDGALVDVLLVLEELAV